MNFIKNLFDKKKGDDILVVGGGGQEYTEKTQRHSSEYYYYAMLVLFIVALLFSYLSTGSLIDDKEMQLRKYYETIEQKKVAQKNLEALQVLSEEVDNIREDQVLLEKALPSSPRYDQVMSYIESLVNEIRKEHFVQMPESVRWAYVSPSDISNPEFEVLDVYEYGIDFLGEYNALLSFLHELRSQLRILDVRSLESLQLKEDGMVSADIIFWAYNLPVY